MMILKTLKMALLIPFWLTPWGKALVQMSWEIYKESPLFQLRAESFGTLCAATLLTHDELRYFLDKTMKKNRFNLKLIFTPYSIFDTLKDKDRYLKSMVNLDKNNGF